jgi:hypothetical protein
MSILHIVEFWFSMVHLSMMNVMMNVSWVWLVTSLHCLKLEAFLNAINTNDNNPIVHIPWEVEWKIGNTSICMYHFDIVLDLRTSECMVEWFTFGVTMVIFVGCIVFKCL